MPKNKQPFDYRQAAGLYIGNGVKSSGNLNTSDDIVIDGEFKGSITTTGFCEITENGQAEGDFKVHSLTVYGRYNGHCQADENVVVKNTADVEGFISYSTLAIQSGATVRARIKPHDSVL